MGDLPSSKGLRLSVVIPALNEAAYLPRCLDSVLAAADRAAPVEILVIDSGSRDETVKVVLEYAGRHGSVRLLANAKRTTPAAFNVGIRGAKAPYVAILSAHSEVAVDFFAAAIERLERGDADIVGGPIRTKPGAVGALPWLLAQIVSHPFGVGNSRFRISQTAGYVDAVPFAVYRRRIFETVGLFDEDLPRNQDTEFFGRVAGAGARVFLDPAVRSTYYARGTLAGLLTQGFRNAYWNVRVWRQNPKAFRWRHAVPGVFALACWSLAALVPFVPATAPAAFGLLVAYGASAVAATAHIAWKTRRPIAVALPPLFLIYHLCYGTGSLAGLRWLVRIRPDIRARRPRDVWAHRNG